MKPFFTSSTACKEEVKEGTLFKKPTKNPQQQQIYRPQRETHCVHTPGERSSWQQAGSHWAESPPLWWRATCAGWGRFPGWLRYSSVHTVCGETRWGQAYALKEREEEMKGSEGWKEKLIFYFYVARNGYCSVMICYLDSQKFCAKIYYLSAEQIFFNRVFNVR